VCENRVLSIIFGPKREEVAGDWRRLHNEELHNLYTNIIRVPTLRRMRWAGHVERMRDMRNTKFWSKIEGRIILEWVLVGGKVCTECI
jgi:hypothetical protein